MAVAVDALLLRGNKLYDWLKLRVRRSGAHRIPPLPPRRPRRPRIYQLDPSLEPRSPSASAFRAPHCPRQLGGG